jgi:hypothetical protein
MMKKIIDYFYRLGYIERHIMHRIIQFIRYMHIVFHSFLATGCRIHNLPHKKAAELYFYYFVF